MERIAGRIYSSALRRSSSPDREHRGGQSDYEGWQSMGWPILATAFFILQMWP
jgi:hypothetical protein